MVTHRFHRIPDPVPHRSAPADGGAPVCEARGYCGPFVNRETYDSFPDPSWHGFGDCRECGTTCRVARHEAMREAMEGTAEVEPPVC